MQNEFRKMNEKVVKRIQWKLSMMQKDDAELSLVLDEPLDSLMQKLIQEVIEENGRELEGVVHAFNFDKGYIIQLKIDK